MEKNADSGEAGGRLVSSRRLVAFAAGLAAYVFVLVVASDTTDATYTTHTVRYLVLVALFYAFLSGVNVAHGYVTNNALHEDASDLAGGVSALVGLGVFYAEVLETSADAAAEGANLLVLGFMTVATVVGMLLILRL